MAHAARRRSSPKTCATASPLMPLAIAAWIRIGFGTIVYKGKPGPFGYHPEEVEAWLAKRFPEVSAPPAPAS